MTREVVTCVTRTRVVLLLALSSCDGRIVGRPGGEGPPADATKERARPPTIAKAPAQLRLLSGVEYRETVKDLLDLEASGAITHADWSGGFDTGANGQDGGGHMLTLQRPVSWQTLPTPSQRAHWLPALPHSNVRPVSQTLFEEQHPRQPDAVSQTQRPFEPCP